ncbi:hypothetical protein BDM02DRAFT_3170324, partial [Thelephora ganbajun]
MKRVWSATSTRKLTKTHRFVAQSTPPNTIGSTSVLGAANVRGVSNIAGDGPPVSLALAIAAGLPIALWTYKCLMLVLFQRKVIYMGYVPPGARTEELSESIIPRGLKCEEIKVSSDNGHSLSGVVVSPSGTLRGAPRSSTESSESLKTLFFYLQGNAGNPLHRLSVFKTLLDHPSFRTRAGLVAVAPRSYWKSKPTRPSERGILSDYTHALNYTIKRWPNSRIVIYGHSLGGSAAVCLASALNSKDYPNVQGLILENPFASIPEMVKALYPQRWLPYHYLTPFVWDTWNAMYAASNMSQNSLLWRLSKDMLVLLSEKDELVPNWMGMGILNATKSKGRSSVVIRDALHENAWEQGQWVREMVQYVGNIGD